MKVEEQRIPFRPDLVLVLGPESTGTRLITALLSRHPEILGTEDAYQHHDILDDVWAELSSERLDEAASRLPDVDDDVILTRRSFPHGTIPGKSDGCYMDFPEIGLFLSLCRREELEPLALLTSRSPAANLVSWVEERSSPDGNLQKAIRQYQAGYRRIFEVIEAYDIPFFVTSLEGLLADQEAYLNSLVRLIDLAPEFSEFPADKHTNSKRYSRIDKYLDEMP